MSGPPFSYKPMKKPTREEFLEELYQKISLLRQLDDKISQLQIAMADATQRVNQLMDILSTMPAETILPDGTEAEGPKAGSDSSG